MEHAHTECNFFSWVVTWGSHTFCLLLRCYLGWRYPSTSLTVSITVFVGFWPRCLCCYSSNHCKIEKASEFWICFSISLSAMLQMQPVSKIKLSLFTSYVSVRRHKEPSSFCRMSEPFLSRSLCIPPFAVRFYIVTLNPFKLLKRGLRRFFSL